MKLKYFLFLSLFFLLLSYSFIEATVRYVSKTGTNSPPYTSWQTAATSIQLCINYSNNGDTIYVANGIYHESLVVNKYLWLIGSSMDSTVIDGTGLAGITIDGHSNFILNGFNIYGKERNELSTTAIAFSGFNPTISNLRISKAGKGIYLGRSSGKIDNVIVNDCNLGFSTFCAPDTCYPEITNCLIFMENSVSQAIQIFDGGSPSITNNIILGINCNEGISVSFNTKISTIKNNIVSGFILSNIACPNSTDSALIENNISVYLPKNIFGWAGIEGDPNTIIRNNITAYSNVGIRGWSTPVTNNNLFWQNISNTIGGASVDSSDIIADPMFFSDTIPINGGSYDYHLQKYSPAIDAGDSTVLDKDGSRSDIGVYGGPLGESYTYQDLAPREPRNISAVVDTNYITLSWNRNTEADTAFYKVYRDTVVNFQIDSTKLISSQADTFFVQINPHNVTRYVYKVTCVDNQGNESKPSTELVVNITSVSNDDYPMTINDYMLYQNFPNPFNPSTKIGYKLKERGYVKVMVYDIKGELVSVLVNKEQNAGYYEVDFVGNGLPSIPNAPQLASGIYLYRIEVIGEGRIPVFSDMKKMLMIK